MKAFYIETCGVFLGFARRLMGGVIFVSADRIEWGWSYSKGGRA